MNTITTALATSPRLAFPRWTSEMTLTIAFPNGVNNAVVYTRHCGARWQKRLSRTSKLCLFTSDAGSGFASKVGPFLACAEGVGEAFARRRDSWLVSFAQVIVRSALNCSEANRVSCAALVPQFAGIRPAPLGKNA
jgi:hypothetical protein